MAPKASARGAGALPKAADLLPAWSTRLSRAAWTVGVVTLGGGVALGQSAASQPQAAMLFTLGSIEALQQYVRLILPALRHLAP